MGAKKVKNGVGATAQSEANLGRLQAYESPKNF